METLLRLFLPEVSLHLNWLFPLNKALKKTSHRAPYSPCLHERGRLTLSFCLCRDRAQEVAKAEIAELGRRQAREDIDLEYLKAVLLKGFESGELPSKSAMLPIISRLLHFSPAEIRLAQSPRKPAKNSSRK